MALASKDRPVTRSQTQATDFLFGSQCRKDAIRELAASLGIPAHAVLDEINPLPQGVETQEDFLANRTDLVEATSLTLEGEKYTLYSCRGVQ